MKKYLLLTLLVMALVLGAPAVIGFKAQASYQLLVERVQQSGLRVVSNRYDRGWFGATAETDFLLVSPAGPAADAGRPDNPRFTLRSAIVHGPLISTGLGLAEIDSQIEFGNEPVFPAGHSAKIHTLVELDGNGRTRVELPATVISGALEMEDLNFGGLSGEMAFDVGRGDVELHLVLAGLEVGSSRRKLVELGETRLDSNSRPAAGGLMLGDGALRVQRLMLHDESSGEPVVAMHELAVDLESSENSGQVKAVASYRLGRLEAAGDVYGPGVLRVELSRLSAAALLRLQQAVTELSGQEMSEAQRGMAVMGVIMSVAAELLKNDPAIVIEPLRLVTPDGTVQGELSIRADGLSLADFTNLSALAARLAADLSLRVPEKLVRAVLLQQTSQRVEQQIAAMIEQGAEVPEFGRDELRQLAERQVDEQLEQWLSLEVVARDGEDLAVVASLASGLLTVNGKTIPLPR